MRKILDAFLGSVKDGIHPREIALAVALGVIAGFVTGWNLTLLVILVGVVLLRVPFQIFGEAWAVSAMAAWMLTPATFHTGRYMLEESPLAATFAASADSWAMVLFDLDRYTLIGGLVWGVLLAVPCSWLTLRFSRSLQVRLRKVGEKIKSASFGIRAICWLVFGSMEGVTQPPKERWLLRPYGAVLCMLTVVPMGAMAWMYGPTMMENSILMTLSRANQAEVAADSFELSLTDGTLQIQNLQIADADELDHDRMRIASLVAVVKPAPMLRGRVHIEKIIIDGITCDVERDSAAKAYPLDLPELDIDLDPHVHFDGSLEDLGYKLETYARNWLEIKDRMNQVQDMLARVDALVHRDDEEDDPELEIPEKYQAMRAMRCTFGSPTPNVVVELIRAKHLAPKWGMSQEAMLEITNLNSEPKLLGCPTRVEFAEPDHSLECVAELNYHEEAPHHLHLTLANVSMTELINWDKLPNMAVAGGTLTFHGEGTFDSHGLELPMQVRMDRMTMTLPGGTRQLGLPSELWNQGLAQLGGMQLDAKLHGEWESPRLDVDTDQLVAQFQHQLHAAGHAMLATAVSEQVQRGQDWVQEQTSEQVARGQEYLNQGRDAAEGALQSGRDAVAGFGQDVQNQLNQTNNQIQNAQNSINNSIHDTVNRALGGVQNQEDLANQFLQNRLNGGNDRYGQNPLADAASGILGAATGNVRQGLNHVGANTGHVIDVAGNTASGAVDQATEANAAVQNTANGGLDAGQNIVGTADQGGRYGLQGAADQVNRYARDLGQAANGAVNQIGPESVSGGPAQQQPQSMGGANVPAEIPLQSPSEADRYGDRYAEYYAQAANQQANTNQQGTTNQQAVVPPAGTNAAPDVVPQTQTAQTPARDASTNSQLAGNQPPTTQQPVGKPAALLYPESMRSARQLSPPSTTAQASRYGTAVQQTADHAAGAYGASSQGVAPQGVAPQGVSPQRDVDRYSPDRYADFYQSADTELEQRPAVGATANDTSPNTTSQRGNPPGPDYYAGTQGAANNASSSGGSRYGAVQDFMEEVGERSAAGAGQRATNSGQQTRQANNATGGLPKMASSSVASDVGTGQAQRQALANQQLANQQRAAMNAGSIPPVGFNRGYVPQEPFTPEEYQALLLMQQQQQAGATQTGMAQAGAAQAGQPAAPQQGSSWKKLASTVTGGAKKLWPFGRSQADQQGTAAAGNAGQAQQQYAAGTNPNNYSQAQQQQAYGAPQQTGQIQQAEAPKDPWYKRLFRR